MSIHSFSTLTAGAAAIAAVMHGGAALAADSVADFYKGKTVSIVVPSGAGGSYHLYCQLVQRHIGQYIPGHPTVIVQNRPGAGGTLAANYMANAAPKDGTELAEIAPGTITEPLVHKHKYDARTFAWLGSIAARPYVLHVWHTVPVKTIEDLKTKEVTMGSSGRGSASYVVPAFINALLGTKIRHITGYKGGGAIDIAMERGEVDGRGNYYSSILSRNPDWITEGKVTFLLGVGPEIPALTKKHVPYMRDFLKPGSVDARVADLLRMNFSVGQAFYMPPGVPEPRVEAMRTAFDKMLADPATRKDVESRKLIFKAQNAEAVKRQIDSAFKAADKQVIARFREIMNGDNAS